MNPMQRDPIGETLEQLTFFVTPDRLAPHLQAAMDWAALNPFLAVGCGFVVWAVSCFVISRVAKR